MSTFFFVFVFSLFFLISTTKSSTTHLSKLCMGNKESRRTFKVQENLSYSSLSKWFVDCDATHALRFGNFA